MFCSQCGKKVSETMLFCPFCGSPIVIPDQDEAQEVEVVANASEPQAEASDLLSIFKPLDDEDEIRVIPEFVPLDVSESLYEQAPMEETARSNPEGEVKDVLPHDEPVRLQGHKPNLTGTGRKNSRKGNDTHVPQRRFNPNDIFFDGSSDSAYDEYIEEDYDDDERDAGFFVRHIRGVVSLSLFAVVAAIVLGWMVSGAGQMSLAKAGLAWNPTVYADLAYSAYHSGGYSLAGSYYAQASERDSDNYDYANSAGVAYYMAGDTIRAEEMARRAISIDSARFDAYDLLTRLYPDEAVRPLEIQGLLQASGFY